MTTLPLSDAYRAAIRTSIVLQVLLTLLMLSLLDGGFIAKVGGYSMAGFWSGVAITMLRRPRDPRPTDLFYIRWGYPFMLMVGIVVALVVISVRHTEWGG
jgi:hypothetical protein